MAKVSVGESHDGAQLQFHAELFETSQAEILIGAGFDQSIRNITILERDTQEISNEVRRLRELAAKMKEAPTSEKKAKEVSSKANELAATAERIIKEQRWYHISGKGLLEAAQAVGEAASPLVASAIKIFELLKKVQGVA